MVLLAILHLLWLMLVPLGVVLLFYGVVRRRRLGIMGGVVALIMSFPALYFCASFWPFDFLMPVRETRMPVTVGKYELTLVHFGGSDFYTTGFEIQRADGKIARLPIDGDDEKWWWPQVETTGGRTYFVRNGGSPTAANAVYRSC